MLLEQPVAEARARQNKRRLSLRTTQRPGELLVSGARSCSSLALTSFLLSLFVCHSVSQSAEPLELLLVGQAEM